MKEHPARWFGYLGLPLALAGTLGFGIGQGGKGAFSYLVALVAATAVLLAAVWFIAFAAASSPRLALMAAMTSYLVTVLGFLVVLLALDRQRVSVAAFAAGLVCAVPPYVAWHLTVANAKAHAPVTETVLPWPEEDEEDGWERFNDGGGDE